MSEENTNLGEEAKDAAKKAAEAASEKASELKEDAKEVFEDVKESTKEFAEDAKETANDFKEGAKEAFDNLSNAGGENKKVIAGVLAIVIGSLGIHKFILGYTKEGIIQIILTFITCGVGSLIGLIEGIIYLTKSDEEFYETYQKNKRPWF